MKIGILSDIHEDIQSLKQAFGILEPFDCDEFVCLGDISGYNVDAFSFHNDRDANKCLSLIKSKCSIVIPGNHDLYNIRRIPEYVSNFIYPENWYELTYDERDYLSQNKIWLYEQFDLSPMLNRKNISYLKSLNEYIIQEFENQKILFSHNAHPDFSGSSKHFIKSQSELHSHFDFMTQNDCQISFGGHQHPEAGIIASSDSFEKLDYGSHKIPNKKVWIVVPSIAQSTRKRGISILDTEEMTFNFIQI